MRNVLFLPCVLGPGVEQERPGMMTFASKKTTWTTNKSWVLFFFPENYRTQTELIIPNCLFTFWLARMPQTWLD